MLVRSPNPVGIDFVLDRVQELLYADLSKVFSADVMNRYKCLPRCYANKAKEGGYVAELYVGNGEYRDCYYDDNCAMTSFFSVSPSVKFDVREYATVGLIVFANLNELYPDAEGRRDEELRMEFVKALDLFNNGMTYTGYETRIENVLKEYVASRRDDGLKYVDMHPKHCFRINFEVLYSIETNC